MKKEDMMHPRQALVMLPLLLLAVAGGLNGCASMASNVRTIDEPRSDGAYLYGRFLLVTHRLMLLEPGAVGNASLVVKCDNGEELRVPFLEEDAVQLLQLKPSQCVLAEMAFENGIGYTLESRSTQIASVKFDFVPGKAHYIGDWDVDVERMRLRGKIHSTMKWKIADRYGETTRMVKTTYPLFSSFATENQLTPRQSNGIVNCVSKGKRVWVDRSQCD
jgi:hypothetical protein